MPDQKAIGAAKSLEARILEDLEKSGFGSELRAIRAFQEKPDQWNVTTSYPFTDLDEDKTREVDFVAHTASSSTHPDGRNINTFYQLVGEVKKTEPPWVVLRGQHGMPMVDRWVNAYTAHELHCDSKKLGVAMSDNALLNKVGWLASGIHQSFKDPSAPSRWYAACLTACKATEHSLKANSEDKAGVSPYFGKNCYFFLAKPLVVVDGPFYSAQITDAGEVKLEKIECACINFSYRTKAYVRSGYYVDMISLNYLPTYLELARQRCIAMHDAITTTLGSPPQKKEKKK